MLLSHSRCRAFILGLLALLLVLPGCGEYPGVRRGVAVAPGPTLTPAGASGDQGSTPTGGQVTAGRTPDMELRDFELGPSELAVPAGEITFTLINAGRFTHDFRVEGEGIDQKAPRVSAGRSSEWSVTLTPGVYRISCPISNHADRGMVGTLTVVADAD